MARWSAARLDEIEEIDDGRCPLRPVRHHFGITSFGVTAWTGRNPGDRIINEHDEDEPGGHEELYFVAQGRARFELDGEQRDAPAGTFVFAEPGVKRTAFAEEPATTIVSMGGAPGKPYEAGGWELWSPLRAPYEAGDYAEVVARGRELAEANPQYPMITYNLACCESLAGYRAEALDHLRQVVERSDELREYARSDSDFDAIRDDPAFIAIVGS